MILFSNGLGLAFLLTLLSWLQGLVLAFMIAGAIYGFLIAVRSLFNVAI